MNYKDFKKISSDEKCTVLRHKDGHELRIAHKVLNSKLKSELDKLPEQKMASGGMVHKYANGGDTNQGISNDPATGATSPVVINIGNGQQDQSGDQTAEPPPPQSQDQKDFAYYSKHASESPDYAQRAKELDAKLNPAPASVAPTPMPANPVDPGQQSASPADNNPPTIMQASQPAAADNSRDQEETPAPQEAPAVAATDNPAAPDQTPYDKGFNDYYQDHAQELGQEDAAWQHDLSNGHVTPETYSSLFAKKDTLGKIGTIFGLMMSGAGSGLSHQPNALLASMNQEINNDLAAQNTSKTNAQNFLRLHQQQQMNEAQIEQLGIQGQLTGAQARGASAEADINSQTAALMKMNRVAMHNQSLMVAKMPEGPQKEQAKQVLAMMGTAVDAKNANIQDIAASKAALLDTVGSGGAANTTAMKMTPGLEELGKDLESKTIPGIPGRAQIPLSSDDRDKINKGIIFQNQLSRFMNWTKTHSGDLNPSDIAEGRAMSSGLSSSYRDSIHGGIYKPTEQDFIGQSIDPDPTKFFNKVRVLPKLNAVQRDSAAQLDQELKSKGFKGYPGTQSSGGGQEGQTATNQKTGAKVIMKNGQWVPYAG